MKIVWTGYTDTDNTVLQCITVIHVIYVLKTGPDSNRRLSVLHILVGVKNLWLTLSVSSFSSQIFDLCQTTTGFEPTCVQLIIYIQLYLIIEEKPLKNYLILSSVILNFKSCRESVLCKTKDRYSCDVLAWTVWQEFCVKHHHTG